MVNKLRSQIKKIGETVLFRSILITATSILFLLQPGVSEANKDVKNEIKKILSQNHDKAVIIEHAENADLQAENFDALGGPDSTDMLTYAQKNIDNYYPDMTEHLDSLMDFFRDQEQKDTVNYLFKENVMKYITDPKQRIASRLYCMETFAFKGNQKVKKVFANTYSISGIIGKENYVHLINFDKGINKRWKGGYLNRVLTSMNKNIEEMNKNIEEMKKNTEEMKKNTEENNKKTEEMKKKTEEMKKAIKQQNEQIEKIINSITVNDVKTNPAIKQWVLDVVTTYNNYGDAISLHLAELISAAKQ